MHLAPGPSAASVYWGALFDQVSAAMPYGPTLHLPSASLAFAADRPGMLTCAPAPEHAAPQPAPLCVCAAEALPFPAEVFACVVGFDVIGHGPRPARVLAEAERVLAPGGRLILAEPWTGFAGRLFHLRQGRRVGPGLDPWFDAGTANAGAPRACLRDRADELARHAPGLAVVAAVPWGGLGEVLAARTQPSAEAVGRHLARLDRLPRPLRHLVNGWLATRALFVLDKRRPPEP